LEHSILFFNYINFTYYSFSSDYYISLINFNNYVDY